MSTSVESRPKEVEEVEVVDDWEQLINPPEPEIPVIYHTNDVPTTERRNWW